MNIEDKKLLELLWKLKRYVEFSENTIEKLCGGCRDIEELIENDAMPSIYWEVIKALDLIMKG